ncbi:hypothetical protein NDA11_004730 [Ustilago hordei]|nr:hypothetical protein NDA11_004730 [Ustilago hordei]
MQATSNSNLFQTSYSEALGAYRSRKAILTSGIPTSSASSSPSSSSAAKRYGFPIHLNPRFTSALLSNPEDLAVEASGADGGRYRVLSLRVQHGFLWSSEAGGLVRQLDLESGRTINLYKGAKGPVPSFDFLTTTAGEKLLVAGSWDKALRIYRISNTTRKEAGEAVVTVEGAMSDFIKAVHIFTEGDKVYLTTGGSDKCIMLWDLKPLTTLSSTAEGIEGERLKCIYQSKQHTRPVNALTSIQGLDGTTRLYSADSMGRVLEHVIHPTSLRLEVVREIQGFSTAVYDLKAGWRRLLVEGESSDKGENKGDAFVSEVKEDADGSRYKLVAEIWGASGDKTALGFRLSPMLQSASHTAARAKSKSVGSNAILGREECISTPHTKLLHKDFVKSILPIPFYLPTNPSLPQFEPFEEALITGGSDEHVRLYPSANSEEEEVYQVEGHWHEITSLACWIRHPNPSFPTAPTSEAVLPPAKEVQVWILSASLDGTIRRWNLLTIATLPKPQFKPVLQEDCTLKFDWDQDSLPPVTKRNLMPDDAVVGTGNVFQMTPEEEAELAELIDSDHE